MLRQKREKNGTGICHVMQGKESNKFKTDKGSQTPHVHDENHNKKDEDNIHYRVGNKKIK